jgi:hypothetical protein
MSEQQLTQSEYALQQIVALFGEPLAQLPEAGVTRIYRHVFPFCELQNIDYLVFKYLITGLQPFEKWAEESLHEGQV